MRCSERDGGWMEKRKDRYLAFKNISLSRSRSVIGWHRSKNMRDRELYEIVYIKSARSQKRKYTNTTSNERSVNAILLAFQE